MIFTSEDVKKNKKTFAMQLVFPGKEDTALNYNEKLTS